ncbi:SulA-like leucine-rich domain-containing protein [Thorsellia kenyensis]|uniref:SulA-like leucine-rich domain-containing protein n=1 Tax=Thorsellia kenyensis TaxID=1549888 RepID=A0ABV6CAU7_9GAMM
MYFNKMTSDSAHYSTSYPMFINTLNMNESYNRDSNSNRIQFIANIEEAMIILPTVFKNLAKKNEFITLIGSPKRFDKQWFKTHHLPLAHFLQINTAKPSIQSMRLVLQALSYGKTSAVVTWLSDTSTEQIRQLEQAAEFGDSIVYILPLTELIH